MNEPDHDSEPVREMPNSQPKVEEEDICWRCGKLIGGQAVCCHCGARAATGPAVNPRDSRRPADSGTSILRLIWIFSALLLVSLIYGWIIHFGLRSEPHIEGGFTTAALIRQLTFECIDSVLVVGALLWVGRPSPLPTATPNRRLAAWLLAPAVLAILLAANFGYSWMLRNILLFPDVTEMPHADAALLGWIVLANCIQPAIVEELFCRYLALGVLRMVINVHGAVLISAIMFGMAHIFNPLFIPVFVGTGIILGYLRVMSGGMLLPMLLHFGHNGFITLLESWL